MMRQASRLAEGAMKVAYENIAPGVRWTTRACDIVQWIYDEADRAV